MKGLFNEFFSPSEPGPTVKWMTFGPGCFYARIEWKKRLLFPAGLVTLPEGESPVGGQAVFGREKANKWIQAIGRNCDMLSTKNSWVIGVILTVMLLTGCVERKLTIVTEPPEAVVWLNDEEIGVTPVTVNFNWYGDYCVRIEKPGYEILNTHKLLERPSHDRFPMDFFAEVLWPDMIVDDYTWTFELEPYRQATPEELIDQAGQMRQKANTELGKIAVEILTEDDK